MERRATSFLVSCALLALWLFAAPNSAAQNPNVNVTTWHQDIPAITGSVYRTGANLSENTITFPISKASFGQYCYYNVDGQVFGQPLVVTNVQISGTTHNVVVYVVTMNGTVYAFDGQPSAPSGAPVQCPNPILQTSLLGSGSPANCTNLGAGGCTVIAPNVGILGTPVINANTGGNTTTGTLYAVVETTSGTPPSLTYSHTLWALDITSLAATATVPISVPAGPPPGCYGANFSKLHIQRPALLLGGDGYLYIPFSMMDGILNPLPNGMMLAYNTANLTNTSTPLCLPTTKGAQNFDGAGIWAGGNGPAYGLASASDSKYYTYFNTGNGVFDLNTGGVDAGDTFVKMYNNPTGNGGQPALQINGSYTPGDQYWRSTKADSQHLNCSKDGDVDFGSGGPLLIPNAENSTAPYLAVSGDKEGGIWFMDRASPGGYNNQNNQNPCLNTISGDQNVQIFAINGGGSVGSGPLIHTGPAFWENANETNYLFLGSSTGFNVTGNGQLMRYQICGSGLPIRTSSNPPCTTQGAFAYETVSTTPLLFPWGTTPSISAASGSESDAIVWTIWADGSFVPTLGFGQVPASSPGRLYAFDATSSTSGMPKLYSSEDCSMTVNGQLQKVDRINPATKYSVPTVADAHVYLGTQGPLLTSTQCSSLSASCFNNGTFYVFGTFSSRSCQ